MACPNCGSWTARADRSLAGRMVCARCGRMLGVAAPSPKRRRPSWPLPRPQLALRWRGWLGLGLLLAVSALLAAQVPEGRRQPLEPGPNPERQAPLT
jgi:hypothetical protein